MEATVGERLSIQVTEIQHKALQRTTTVLIVANVYTSVAAKRVAHVGRKAASKASAKAGAKAAGKVGRMFTAKATTYASGDAIASGAEILFPLTKLSFLDNPPPMN